MRKHVVTAVFKTHHDATRATEEVRKEGLRMSDISILTKHDLENGEGGGYSNDNISGGTMSGGLLGGLAGLVLGVGTIAVPGLGIVAAAGPIAGLLSGAITGGIIGALVDLGIPNEKAREYNDDIESGKVLWSMETEDDYVDHVREVLKRCGADKMS